MAPTTVTTIILCLLATGILTMAGWGWLSSWQPVVRRVPEQDWSEADIDAAVSQLRRSIDHYERRQTRR